ncbi:MAG: precorrin-6A reductase [Bacillota bacterium]
MVLGGTTEAREAVRELARHGYPVIATAVTAHGASLLRTWGAAAVLQEAMDEARMRVVMETFGVHVLLDATHPYAAMASVNALRAATASGVPYVRLERPPWPVPKHPRVHCCPDYLEAARLACQLAAHGCVFLAIGSKRLRIFAEEARLRGVRLIARVLPDPGVLAACFEEGLGPADLVALQGPVSRTLNEALFRQFSVDVVVTKESGREGGTPEKVEAAVALGLDVIVVKRPAPKGPPAEGVAEALRMIEEEMKGEGSGCGGSGPRVEGD